MLLRSTEVFFCNFQILIYFYLPTLRKTRGSIAECIVVAKSWGFLSGCSEKRVMSP